MNTMPGMNAHPVSGKALRRTTLALFCATFAAACAELPSSTSTSAPAPAAEHETHTAAPMAAAPPRASAPVNLVASIEPEPELSAASALSMSCAPALQELQDPPTIEHLRGEGGISSTMTIAPVEKCINGRLVELQSYLDSQAGTDSRPVGPAYIMYVDESLPNPVFKLDFRNELSDEKKVYDCDHHSDDVLLCTNLHLHGLHVSPSGNSDNVFLSLAPFDIQPYEFDIPNTHPEGTHWLHAHLHGSTAPQLRNGMSGALILKGPLDDWLATYGIRGRRDKIMLLQQLQDSEGDVLCGQDAEGDDRTTSINGQCLPIINVQEGEVHHWRLIHAGISQTVDFAIETAPAAGAPQQVGFYEYARDGIALGRAMPMTDNLLQPGYRSDILVQMPSVDTYCPGADSCELHLVDAATDIDESLRETAEAHNVIAKLIVHRSNAPAMVLPPLDDPHFAKPYSEISDAELSPVEQRIRFANAPNPDDPNNPLKTVNGKVYPDTETIELKLNDAQTWRVWVDPIQASGASHPYHIHVNPFEVIERNAAGEIVNRYWKDTLLVSGSTNKGEANAVELRSRYETFDGAFVLHCHNLDHEDQGMMMKVVINP